MEIKEDWMNKKWRPAMGWMYMVICITDFILFPVLWAIFQAYTGQKVEIWQPLTLEGAGLFHMAMGAVLGVAAWSRGREKMLGVAGETSYESADSHEIYHNQPQSRTPQHRRHRPFIQNDPEI